MLEGDQKRVLLGHAEPVMVVAPLGGGNATASVGSAQHFSTEIFMQEGESHGNLEAFEGALSDSDETIAPSMLYAYAALLEGVPFCNGAPNLTVDTPALRDFATERRLAISCDPCQRRVHHQPIAGALELGLGRDQPHPLDAVLFDLLLADPQRLGCVAPPRDRPEEAPRIVRLDDDQGRRRAQPLVLPEVDLVLVMSVNPGFGGQAYIATMEPKIAALRTLIDSQGHDVDIEVSAWRIHRSIGMDGSTLVQSLFKDRPEMLRAQTAWSLLGPGTPFIYYGNEIAQPQGPERGDTKHRKPLDWSAVEAQRADASSVWRWHQELIRLRGARRAAGEGDGGQRKRASGISIQRAARGEERAPDHEWLRHGSAFRRMQFRARLDATHPPDVPHESSLHSSA